MTRPTPPIGSESHLPGRTIAIEPESPEGMTRRSALQLMAASLALASGACTRIPEHRLYPYVSMPEAGRGDRPAYYASAVVRDGYAEGVLVGTRDGRPIKIEGNPSHPSSLGSTSVFAQAAVLELWDPDRSQAVLEQLPAGVGTGLDGKASARAAPSTWAAFDEAWRQRATAFEARGGEGLAVLTGCFTSPTLGRQLQALMTRFPKARWHRHAPLAPNAARAGARAAFGRELDFVLHFDRARFVLGLDADPFSQVPGHIRHARDWAGQRAGAGNVAGAGEPSRSFAVETTPGLFGARADERVAMAPAAIEALVDELAAGLAAVAGSPSIGSPPAAPVSPLSRRLIGHLSSAGKAALVVVGPALSARCHAQVAAIHHRLGAFGHSLDAIEPVDGVDGLAPRSLSDLVDAMDGGAVDSLFIVGGNPAYDAPGALEFGAALQRVPFSAHLALHEDETSRRVVWHLPASHEIESWGDARAHDGTATIVQPAILPLYDTRSPIELVALLAGGGRSDGHALVQEAWRQRRAPSQAEAGEGDAADARFAAWWRDTLSAGVVAGSAAAPASIAAASVITSPAPPRATAIVAVFVADASVGDGRYANNGWLQELPRPLTKLTWDNAVVLAPRTAARLGLATGDVARVTAGGRHVEGPVWVLAEHAEDAATLPLGYGRSVVGRVGNGVGFDAYRLRGTSDAPLPVTIEPTGARHRFAVTQHRLDQMGRDLARTVAPGQSLPKAPAKASLYPPVAYPDHAWAMVIDLDACIGCNACTIACQAENNIPVVGAEQVAAGREMHWIRVDRYPADEAGGGSIFQPVPCMHCEDAPCEVVCPVGATVHDSEGLNVQVYNRCVGTRFCSNNCPYKVRRFNFLQYADETTETLKAMHNPDVTVRQVGVMEKCTYCLQRLSRARLHAEKAGAPIADGDVLTACQSACPTLAIHFGDLNDAASDVVRAKRSPRHYAMLDELNTRPRTTYLARVAGAASNAAPPGKEPT